MDQVIGNAIWQPHFNFLVIGIFSAIGLFLAAVGIYGVMSYAVSQSTRDIGVRIALGAQQHDILGFILRQGILLAGIGILIGLIGSLISTRVISSLLFSVSPRDPMTYMGVSLVLIVVAVVACLIPARRAIRIDPIEALRYE